MESRGQVGMQGHQRPSRAGLCCSSELCCYTSLAQLLLQVLLLSRASIRHTGPPPALQRGRKARPANSKHQGQEWAGARYFAAGPPPSGYGNGGAPKNRLALLALALEARSQPLLRPRRRLRASCARLADSLFAFDSRLALVLGQSPYGVSAAACGGSGG